MPKISPEALRKSRDAKRLSQQDLAQKAKIDKSTISRIERGSHVVRNSVFRRLHEVLEISPEVLAGNEPLPESAIESRALKSELQMNTRINDSARNALTLVANRYNLPASQIIELAPFLFVCAAEQSLKQRRDAVAALEVGLDNVWKLHRAGLDHLSHNVVTSYRSEEILSVEKEFYRSTRYFWFECRVSGKMAKL